MPGHTSRGLVLLLHGWEGSVDSSYMQLTAAQPARRAASRCSASTSATTATPTTSTKACSTPTASTKSCARRCEVVATLPGAADGRRRLFARRQLRTAPGVARAGGGMPLAHVAAVCPVLDPARTMEAMEHGLPLYHVVLRAQVARFAARASASCSRSARLRRPGARPAHARADAWMVERHTEFGTLERLLRRLFDRRRSPVGAAACPASILMSRRTIRSSRSTGFHALHLPPTARPGDRRARRPLRLPRELALRRLRRALGRRATRQRDRAGHGTIAGPGLTTKEFRHAPEQREFRTPRADPRRIRDGDAGGFRRQSQPAPGVVGRAGGHAIVRADVHRYRCADGREHRRPRRHGDSGRPTARGLRALGDGRHSRERAAHRRGQLQRRRDRAR